MQELKSFPTEQLVEELKSREKKEISDAVAELLISLSKHGDLASLEAIRAIFSDANPIHLEVIRGAHEDTSKKEEKKAKVKVSFAAAVHERILPEIDRVFHELISTCITFPSNSKLEVERSAEWLKPIICAYIDDQKVHCFSEIKDQTDS